MPLTKQRRCSNPLWKAWDIKAQKEGLHQCVYDTNGDVYTGDWKDNKRHGKGSMLFNNGQSVYDGDWKNNFRHGHGKLCVRIANLEMIKYYVGGWKYDKKHGFGTRYYKWNEYYEGEWYANLRCGWGRMFYADGSIYEGEWLDDKRSGDGILRFPNENRYDGKWLNDMKNGAGKFFHLDRGHLFIGWWVDNIPKCGTFEDYKQLEAANPSTYSVPKCLLDDPTDVLHEAIDILRRP